MLYSNILSTIIQPILGVSTTTSSQLDKVGRQFLPQFKGSHAADQIPNLNNQQCTILNLDKLGSPGSHWIGVFKSNDLYHIYDSFGRSTRQIIPSLDDLSVQDADYDAEQDINQNNCGQRCLAWLILASYWNIKTAMMV